MISLAAFFRGAARIFDFTPRPAKRIDYHGFEADLAAISDDVNTVGRDIIGALQDAVDYEQGKKVPGIRVTRRTSE